MLLGDYSDKKIASDPAHFIDLFIDSTMIKNIGGIDCIGRNHYDRGRYGSKISVIIDREGTPISAPVVDPSNRNDILALIPTVMPIKCPIKNDNRMVNRLAGDLAYISQEKSDQLYSELKIRVVVDQRKNAVESKPMRKKDIAMFKKRVNIEHFFARLKQSKRIRQRAEQSMLAYQSMAYIAFSCIIFNKTPV